MGALYLVGIALVFPCYAMDVPSQSKKITYKIDTCFACKEPLRNLDIGRVPTLTLLALKSVALHKHKIESLLRQTRAIDEEHAVKDMVTQTVKGLNSLSLYNAWRFFLYIRNHYLWFEKEKMHMAKDSQGRWKKGSEGIHPVEFLWRILVKHNNYQALCNIPSPEVVKQHRVVYLLSHVHSRPVEDHWYCLQELICGMPSKKQEKKVALENLFCGVLYTRYQASLLDKLVTFSHQIRSPYTYQFLERSLVRAAYFVNEEGVCYLCCHTFVKPKGVAVCGEESNCAIALTKSLLANAYWQDKGKKLYAILVDHKMDINHVPLHSFTASALSQAAHAGNVEVAKMLITYGARLDAHSGVQDSPLAGAKEGGHQDMVVYLQKCGRPPAQ